MEFRTVVPPLRHQGLISHHTGLLMLGSCFTDNVSTRLADDLFDVTANPCGTLYNPLSIANAIGRMISTREYTADDLFLHQGLWRSLDHHSSLCSSDKERTLELINGSLRDGIEALRRAGVLIVTWGSSTAYIDRLTGQCAANCHKLPSERFEVATLSPEQIVSQCQQVISDVRQINPDVTFIVTVSPIRHKAYGLDGNSLSKARLIEAAHQLADSEKGIIYFPSYEIMMDDLRDYRFYASDMIHPSETACDYIYDIFAKSFFDEPTSQLAQQSRRLTRRMRHRLMTDDPTALEMERAEINHLISSHISAYPQTERALERIKSRI